MPFNDREKEASNAPENNKFDCQYIKIKYDELLKKYDALVKNYILVKEQNMKLELELFNRHSALFKKEAELIKDIVDFNKMKEEEISKLQKKDN